MVYTKQSWSDLPDQSTPITAARLNKLETQYDEAAALVAPKLSKAQADLLYAAIGSAGGGGVTSDAGFIVGKDGKTYRIVSGVIRNDGAPNYWQPIIDSDHQGDLNVTGVTTVNSYIEINHEAINAKKVVSFIAAPDDTLARAGFFTGTSVGLTKTRIFLGQNTTDYTDYVYYNGTSWVSTTNSGVTLSYTNGVLNITHPAISNGKLYKLNAVTRSGKYVAQLANSSMATTTSMAIEFRDTTTNALATTPDTGMRVLVSHGGGQINDAIIHRDVDVTTYPGSNIWFYGIFEVSSTNLPGGGGSDGYSPNLTPIYIETRDTGLASKSPDNLRTGQPSTVDTGGGYTNELSIAVTGTKGSTVLTATAADASKVAALGTNRFAAVLNRDDGNDDFFATVMSNNGTNQITLRRPLAANFSGTISAKYDAVLGQHLTRAGTRAYVQHALKVNGATGGRGGILAGTWDALPPTYNQAWQPNAALVAYGKLNSPAPIVRTEQTLQTVHNILSPVDFIELFPYVASGGVMTGTHKSGHGSTATIYTGRKPSTVEFYTSALRTGESGVGYNLRVIVTGDGVTLYDSTHDAFMTRVVVPATGFDKITVNVTNNNTTDTPYNIYLTNLMVREAGTSGKIGRGKVVVLGDSWGAFYDGALGKALARKTGSTVVTNSLGGTTTDWALDWFDQYVIAENPDEVWIHFFTNDANQTQLTYTAPDGSTKPLWPAGLTLDQAMARWRQNIQTLIFRAQQAGIRPVIFMPGGTASESQSQRHVVWAQALERPPLIEWSATEAELLDSASYVNNYGKRTGTRVMVGTSPRYATGPLPADAWVTGT